MAKLAPRIAFLSLLSLSGWAFGDQVAISKFGLLNNNNNSVTIDPSQSQDLLNVDVTPGGLSVKKRFGYGTYKALGTGQPIHGGYHFYDSSGNDVQIWGSSTSLYGIVADAMPTQLISSATLNSTWDCVDTQNSAYCVNSNRNAFVKTNGATMTWFATPLGTMVEATPDRVVVAGVSASPNTLFVSQSNTFTNFTTGVNATDAFNEVIASPGSKLTNIRWACGKLLWWKDASFGYFDFDDQYVAQVKTVSDVIGTFDNTSAVDPGGRVWFRGQDGHTWMYDCSVLTKQSIDITPNIQITGKRIANSWTQSTQADFQAGSGIPSTNFSFAVSPGDVVLSSFTSTDYLTFSSMTLSGPSELSNNSFESGQSTNWTLSGTGISNVNSASGNCGSINAQDGTFFEQSNNAASLKIVLSSNTAVIVSSITPTYSNCTWTLNSLAVPSPYRGFFVKSAFFDGANYTLTSDSFIANGNAIQFYTNQANHTSPSFNVYFFDFVTNSPKATQAAATSSIFDSGITKTTVQLQSSWVTISTPTISLQTATSAGGSYSTILTSTGTNTSTGSEFFRYVATFTFSASDSFSSSILGTQSIVAVSTGGVYYSAVRNAPNFTSWNTIGANTQQTGGTETLYVRAGGTLFSVLSSTPGWIAQTNGNLISATTGAYMQFRDDFTSTYATSTLALNDFTLNWFEGSAADQAYMTYFDNAIWESVPFGVGQSTNNYIFKYDLINDGFTLYNFGANGLAVQNNALYFGDTSSGNIFNFGTVKADNGSAIQAYWKSKDFTGNDPFMQSALTNIDTFAKKDQGSTLTATYTTDTSTSTAYSITLSTSASVIQNRKLLPAGKNGYTFNVKYGDTSSSSQWEVLGVRIGFNALSYRPTQ